MRTSFYVYFRKIEGFFKGFFKGRKSRPLKKHVDDEDKGVAELTIPPEDYRK